MVLGRGERRLGQRWAHILCVLGAAPYDGPAFQSAASFERPTTTSCTIGGTVLPRLCSRENWVQNCGRSVWGLPYTPGYIECTNALGSGAAQKKVQQCVVGLPSYNTTILQYHW